MILLDDPDFARAIRVLWGIVIIRNVVRPDLPALVGTDVAMIIFVCTALETVGVLPSGER